MYGQLVGPAETVSRSVGQLCFAINLEMRTKPSTTCGCHLLTAVINLERLSLWDTNAGTGASVSEGRA